ncbi:hypothetical protein MAR_035648 [Mya arenaria]|uniref:Uncharacterized protein n=1 Tax=Mya arenaria TaxID=6604 RepID=A0ABY7ENL9_MYAAR|nr:hypothetical protein MAR_035648 [Mya arenaria]
MAFKPHASDNCVSVIVCKDIDNHFYSGSLCEIEQEKLALPAKYIAAIAASCGAVVIIVAIVIIVCIVKRTKKKRNDRPYTIGMTDFRTRPSKKEDYTYLDNRELSSNPYHFATNYGYEREDLPETRMVEGREHKVTKDEKGQELYIYQPSGQPDRPNGHQRSHSWYSSASSVDLHRGKNGSTYDYIDTSIKFEIQRPNIRQNNFKI